MNVEQQIEQVTSTLKSKSEEIAAILLKSTEKGMTPDEAQESAITALENDVEVLEKNLKRLNSIKSMSDASNKTEVLGQTEAEGIKSAAGTPRITVHSVLPKGIGFTQYVRSKMVASLEHKKGNLISPAQVAKQLGFGEDVVKFTEKATLGTTTDAGFASPLLDTHTFHGDFIELLRQKTIFDKLDGYRSVPFNTKIKGQLTGGTSQWVGEGKAKPLTNPTFGDIEIKEHKLASIVAQTEELIRRASPAVDEYVLTDLLNATAELIDDTLIYGDGIDKPKGIILDAPSRKSAGATAEEYEQDILWLLEEFIKKNMSADKSYFLMSETRAARLSVLRDALGKSYFDGLNFNGSKSLLGIPVITSERVGDKIILIKASELLVAQDGGVDVSYSDQATLVDGNITHNLWQENKIAIRVEKFITWAARRPTIAAYVQYKEA